MEDQNTNPDDYDWTYAQQELVRFNQQHNTNIKKDLVDQFSKDGTFLKKPPRKLKKWKWHLKLKSNKPEF